MIMEVDLGPIVNQNDPWLIAETTYPAQGTVEQQLEFLINYAVLAPSRYNSQPWGFIRRDDILELRLDQTRLLPVTDSRAREAIMGCGTALYYLQIAMRYFGHTPIVEVLPEQQTPEMLAYIRQGEPVPASEEVKALFHAIRHRRTWERRFRPDRIPIDLQQSLQTAASQEHASLIFLPEPEQRRAVAEMVHEGERTLQANSDYRSEAASWASNTGHHAEIPTLISLLRETFTPHWFDPGLVLTTPALAILGTDCDTPYDWIAAGQALGAILLKADIHWLEASFLNQPIEVLNIRPRLQQLVDGIVPQLILRLGFVDGHYVSHKPRRGVAEVEYSL